MKKKEKLITPAPSVPATITNLPGETAEVKTLPRHKKNAEVGEKQTVYYKHILLEQADARSVSEGEELTLMDWGNAIVRKKVVEGDKVTSLELELHLAGDVKKTKLKVGGSLWFFSCWKPSSVPPRIPLAALTHCGLRTTGTRSSANTHVWTRSLTSFLDHLARRRPRQPAYRCAWSRRLACARPRHAPRLRLPDHEEEAGGG